MTDSMVQNAIEQSKKLSPASSKGDRPLWALFTGRVNTGFYVPPWWSPSRDVELGSFWKKVDHLSGAVYSMEAKMSAIPRKIVPLDPSIREQVEEADSLTDVINYASAYGKGWVSFYSKFVRSLLTQDNGAFALIIGKGSPDGPIVGRPISVVNLSSARCQRTGDSDYPVIYHANDGKSYKLHWTRVIYEAQMPSEDEDMFEVGFCAVSRVLNVAQTILDVMVYKQEQLGSRPHQALLLTQGGLDPTDVAHAFEIAEQSMSNQGLTRYSKVVMTGSSTIMDADVKVVQLNQMPAWFDEYNATILAMSAIALGFGVDARELFPAIGAGATRADALIQHLKQRGKGPGQIIELTEQAFNAKFLPPYLKMVFDFQDDTQDRQSAEIAEIRTRGWNQSLTTGTLDSRTIREQMVETGMITRAQFDRLELEDGRLPSGADVTTMFYVNNPKVKKFLSIPGFDDPLAAGQEIVEPAEVKRTEAMVELANAKTPEKRWNAMICIAAIDALLRKLADDLAMEQIEEVASETIPEDHVTDPRKTDLTAPTSQDTSVEPRDNNLEDEADS